MSATYHFGQPFGKYPSVQNPRIQYQDEEEQEYEAYAHQRADTVAVAAAASAAQYRAHQQLPVMGKKTVEYANVAAADAAAPSTLPSVPGGGVNLIKAQTDPWGEGGTGLGLKIMCGALGLIIVILLVIMIVKMVNHNNNSSSSSSSRSTDLSSQGSQDQLPMSLQGGMMFADESFMSTAEL